MEDIEIGAIRKKKTGVFGKFFLLVIVIFVLFVFYVSLDANKYRATVHVIEGEGRIGVNPTTLNMDFGDLSPGTSAVRTVTIENNTSISVYVLSWQIGEISQLMNASKNSFVLSGGETEQVEFTVYMPASAEINATYDGRVYLFKIPGPWQG